MTIGITGASGFVGQALVTAARQRGHRVIGYSRSPERKVTGCHETRAFRMDQSVDVSGCETIIHLAGEPIVGLWTESKKARIRRSREVGTCHLVSAIKAAVERPRALISSSAVGFYGDSGEQVLTEMSPPGLGYLSDVCVAWEREALRAQAFGLRVVLARTSIVLGKGGGALAAMTPIFRAGLGGRLASGRQWMPWIHLDDAGAMLLFAAEEGAVSGPMNLCAPHPVRNAEFTDTLADVLHRPAILPVPRFALAPLGDFKDELLDSKRTVPQSALAAGFTFNHPHLAGALMEIFERS